MARRVEAEDLARLLDFGRLVSTSAVAAGVMLALIMAAADGATDGRGAGRASGKGAPTDMRPGSAGRGAVLALQTGVEGEDARCMADAAEATTADLWVTTTG